MPTRFAAEHWRSSTRPAEAVPGLVIHTSSTSGLVGNPGQTNYGAAKAGHRRRSASSAPGARPLRRAVQLHRPAARTRLTRRARARLDDRAAPGDGRFDVWDPANVSPLVAYLATADCPFTGTTFYVQGGAVKVVEPWRFGDAVERDDRWTDRRARRAPWQPLAERADLRRRAPRLRSRAPAARHLDAASPAAAMRWRPPAGRARAPFGPDLTRGSR